jgi:hypothetical protein
VSAAQLVIAATGLLALVTALHGGEEYRGLAAAAGLAGQPFWLWVTWQAGQVGMFVVACGYTAVWAVQLWKVCKCR